MIESFQNPKNKRSFFFISYMRIKWPKNRKLKIKSFVDLCFRTYKLKIQDLDHDLNNLNPLENNFFNVWNILNRKT